jgi:3-oxoacyl-[acyl-carrier-protein] synthase-3
MSEHPTGILGLGSYVPDRVMTNDDWARYVDTSDEWIFSRTGIRRRRIAADDQSTVDLALPAASAALADAGLEPRDVDEIIVATDTPEIFVPDTAAFIQHRLGAGEVPAYDLGGSGCAGFLMALDIARARASGGRKILVLGVELLTRLIDWTDRTTCVLFGDAAGAVVVGEREDAVEILAAHAGTDGSRTDILSLEVGGTRSPFTLERAQKREHRKINFNGREVFKTAVARMTEASRKVLEIAGYSIEDVALVVPHQANLRILKAVGKTLQVPEEKLFLDVEDYGNTGSASVPLALSHAREQGRIGSGDLVLLSAFGAGFHWAAAVLRF